MIAKKIFIAFLFFTFHFSLFTLKAQSWKWGEGAKTTAPCGNGAEGFVSGITIDRNCNAYSSGYFSDTISFGLNKLFSRRIYLCNYEENPFLIKYDSGGNVKWAIQADCPGTSWGYSTSTACDNFGHIYQAGYFRDTINFGPNTLINSKTNPTGGYIVKYSQNSGGVSWAKKFNCNAYNVGYGVSTDVSGNVYITGFFGDSLSFVSNKLFSKTDNAFLVKLDSAGNAIWAVQSKAPYFGNSEGYSITSNSSGRVSITGYIHDTVIFGNDTLIDYGGKFNQQAFIAQYNNNGSFLWAHAANSKLDTSSFSFGYSVAGDNNGNTYLCGSFEGTITFGSHNITSDSMDIFLVKYNSSGDVLWVEAGKRLDSNNWFGTSVATDTLNHIYLSGLTTNMNSNNKDFKIVFGTDTFGYPNNQASPGIIIEFDSGGNALCGSIIKEENVGEPTLVTSDNSGKYVYVGGTLQDTSVFGTDTVTYPVPGNPFTARWESCSAEVITGAGEIRNNAGISICPNPANGKFIVSMQNANEPAQMEIYDISGACVYKTKINSNKKEINIETQPAGIYFLRIIIEGGGLVGEGKVVMEK